MATKGDLILGQDLAAVRELADRRTDRTSPSSPTPSRSTFRNRDGGGSKDTTGSACDASGSLTAHPFAQGRRRYVGLARPSMITTLGSLVSSFGLSSSLLERLPPPITTRACSMTALST